MESSKLFLLVSVMVVLTTVLAYAGAEEPPPPSEGICYKVFYEANFNELIKLRPHDPGRSPPSYYLLYCTMKFL